VLYRRVDRRPSAAVRGRSGHRQWRSFPCSSADIALLNEQAWQSRPCVRPRNRRLRANPEPRAFIKPLVCSFFRGNYIMLTSNRLVCAPGRALLDTVSRFVGRRMSKKCPTLEHSDAESYICLPVTMLAPSGSRPAIVQGQSTSLRNWRARVRIPPGVPLSACVRQRSVSIGSRPRNLGVTTAHRRWLAARAVLDSSTPTRIATTRRARSWLCPSAPNQPLLAWLVARATTTGTRRTPGTGRPLSPP